MLNVEDGDDLTAWAQFVERSYVETCKQCEYEWRKPTGARSE